MRLEPGRDEQFDADRFGMWLEVMVDAGVSSAAATLAAMDVDLLAAGFVEHLRVFDYAVAPFITIDATWRPARRLRTVFAPRSAAMW